MFKILFICAALAVSQGLDLLGEEMINFINKQPNMTWTAGKNFAVSCFVGLYKTESTVINFNLLSLCAKDIFQLL